MVSQPRKHNSFGYITAGLSKGSFFFVLIGIGVLGVVGTGFGYLASITNPLKWFPDKNEFVTGIATAGFGLGSYFVLFAKETAQLF